MLFTITSHSQVYEEWVQRYNGPGNSFDYAYKIDIDNFGNIYVAGHSAGIGSSYDYTIIKYNSSGVQQWFQRYNGPGNSQDDAQDLKVDASGNIYVTGNSVGIGTNYDYATIKYNSLGIQQWVQRYNGPINGTDVATSIAIDNSGNVYVTGRSDGIGNVYDYATIKYNSLGIQQWVQRYNGPGNFSDQANSIGVDNSGNVYVTGWSVGNGTSIDYATIKYNTGGVQQWIQRFNGTGNGEDFGNKLILDNSGNVYVTGRSVGASTGIDYATVKYNSSGIQQWVQTYNGPGNVFDEASSITIDGSGNVYVSGNSVGNTGGRDYAIIKYNNSGLSQWVQRYNGIGNGEDFARDLIVDNLGNVYVTGSSEGNGSNYDYATIKYNSSGALQWLQRYNGAGNGSDYSNSIGIDNFNNVYITGYSVGNGSDYDFTTIKYSQQQLSIIQPSPYTKWISGDTNIIQWSGWNRVNIKCQVNSGTTSQSDSIIALDTNLNQPEYHWKIHDNFLSFRSKIIIENAANPTQKIESGIFRIKPYLLTRVNPDSTYYEYRKNRDQWGFWNQESQMFDPDWYDQFDYQGIDPFTGSQYSQWQGAFTFRYAKPYNFTDWVSYVNTFTVSECYWNASTGNYKELAVLKWSLNKKKKWDGSCFGIAVSNGLVFRNKTEFLNKYTNYPSFSNPLNVTSTNEVKKVINELFTHQFGEPHQSHRNNVGYGKTPTQTLIELKAMLLSENDPIRALSFYKSSPSSAGHTVLPYYIKQSTNNSNVYFVYIYDNEYPFSNNPIIINTSDNGGKGFWSTPDWPDWGGDRYIFLEDPVQTYLSNPTDAKNENSKTGLNTVQILNSKNYSYIIKDFAGNISGYINDSLKLDILNSYPLIYLDGSEGPPYGFELPNADYKVELKNFSEDTIQASIFINNLAFSYERFDADTSQTDKIYFNNGLSVVNSDTENKTIKLLNIQKESTHEKLFAFSSIELTQNDSIKIENLGSKDFKLISYGSTKSYDIELNYASQTELGRFINVNIDLPSNSSHTFLPVWNNVTSSQLVILEDIGNNGTIDDTLRINNIITGTGDGFILLPDKYSLEQNYPNPFNPSTLIKYDIKKDGFVSLKVYNILGKEVASIVNEVKRAGRYEVEFNGSNLGSGIYYYRLQAGEFSETRKMLLLK